MEWKKRRCVLGDIIRVSQGAFYHYGIYEGGGSVIQFGAAPRLRVGIKDGDIKVCRTTLDKFGGEYETALLDSAEFDTRRSPEEAVSFAVAKLGTGGYNILHNNCEHFVYECVFGKRYCSMTEEVRQYFRSFPVVDAYTAVLPDGELTQTLYPTSRDVEVRQTANEKFRRQRYFVWRLLEYAVKRSFGKGLSELEITKNENGKWCAEGIFISLSHSEKALAVAVSRTPVGVDIERMAPVKSERIADKILTPCELQAFSRLEGDFRGRYLIEKWTEKESIFKMRDDKVFSPAHLSAEGCVRTDSAVLSGEEYIISVCSENIDRLKVYADIKL